MLDLPAKPDWRALTAAERLELMEPYRLKGIGSVQIAAQFINATRNAVCGALDRAGRRLLSRKNPGRPSLGESALRANGNKGQPKAAAIRHAATIRVTEYTPIRPAAWEPLGDAMPISLMDLPARAGTRCRWPVTGGYCGIKSGTKTYCEDHQRMAYKNEPGRF